MLAKVTSSWTTANEDDSLSPKGLRGPRQLPRPDCPQGRQGGRKGKGRPVAGPQPAGPVALRKPQGSFSHRRLFALDVLLHLPLPVPRGRPCFPRPNVSDGPVRGRSGGPGARCSACGSR